MSRVRKTPASAFASAILDCVREYTEEVKAGIRAEVEQAAEDIKRDISAKSPTGRTGKYAKGWKIDKQDTRSKVVRVVHNKPRYMLVHLLEKGHASRNGGRVSPSPAGGHVKPVAEKRLQEMVRNFETIIERGG